MNKPTVFNKAEILYSSVMTDELNTNSTIAIVDFQNNDNQAVVNSAIMIAELRDYNKPMGVATYKTSDEMPEALTKENFLRDWSIKEAMFKMSDDNSFDPKKYDIINTFDTQTKVVKYKNEQYALALVQESKGFVSYHFYSDDIAFM